MSTGFAQAAADREKIREEMSTGFAQARVERKEIEEVARGERKAINTELIRQNQNYIEHLVYHNTPKANPVSESEEKENT